MQMHAICFPSAASVTVLRSGSLFLGNESYLLGCSAEGGYTPCSPYAAIPAMGTAHPYQSPQGLEVQKPRSVAVQEHESSVAELQGGLWAGTAGSGTPTGCAAGTVLAPWG